MTEYFTINPPTKPEEKKIYEIVSIISFLQNKIASIKQQTEKTKYNPIYLKILSTNNEIKNLQNKINQYQNEQRQNEINFNKEKMNLELNLKKIENELASINSKLNDMMLGGDKEIYNVSNDKIEEILLNKTNEDIFNGLTIDYNSMQLTYQKLLNDLETNLNKKKQLDEQSKMLKEEKNTINVKIIEYISQKESYEEMAKIILLRYFNQILNYNINYNNKLSENQIKDFELSNGAATSFLLKSKNFNLNNNYNLNVSKNNLDIYSYELNNIDIKKLSHEISSQLISYISNCMKSLNDNNTNMNILNSNNISIINKSTNKSLNNSKIFSNEINSLINSLSSKICKNILKFISENDGKNDNINIFFNNLSKEITNLLNSYFITQLKIKNNEIENCNTDEMFVTYIKLMFKTFYLDNITSKESNFLNNEYKNIKNSIKSNLSLILGNITKLNIKKNEYDSKLNVIYKKKQFLSNDILLKSSNLSLKERAYLHLTNKSNQLIELKKGIQKEFLNKKNNLIRIINIISQNIEENTQNIENLYKKIGDLENQMEKKMEIGNIEISKIQKLINDNYRVIQNEISLYKQKYGNNLDLYEKFDDNINNCLRATSKSLLRKKSSTSNSFYKNNISYMISPINHIRTNSFVSSFYNYPNGTIKKEKNNKSFSYKKINNVSNLVDSVILNENESIPHNKSRNYYDKTNNIIFNSYNIDNLSKQIYNNDNKFNNVMNKKNNLKNTIDVPKEKITEKSFNIQEKINNNSISKSISYNDLQIKLKNLTKLYQCYFRQFNSMQKIFDPLYHSALIENYSLFKFEKCYIKLYFEIDKIYLLIFKEKEIFLRINIINLEMTIINKNIKYITKIYQEFKEYLKVCGNNFDLDKFIESKELKNIPMDSNIKKLAVNNIYFNFSIVVLNNKFNRKDRYEFILEGYDNFKEWVNNLNYLINLKNVLSDE